MTPELQAEITRIVTGQPRPVPDIPCSHRHDHLGVLTCNCQDSLQVFSCDWHANGYCVLLKAMIPMDGYIAFLDGTKSKSPYLPWIDGPTDRLNLETVLVIPVCSLCPDRKIVLD